RAAARRARGRDGGRRARGAARPRLRDRAPRRPRGAAHEPDEALLAGARHHEGRLDPVLRRRRARPPAPRPRPRDGDEAVPERRRGSVLLHEAGPVAAAALDRALLDRTRVRQRDRLPDDPGPPLPPLGRQPRLHRPEPVVRPLRRRRPARLPPLRPRPRPARGIRAGPRGGARRPPGARRPRDAELGEDDRLARAPRLRADRPRPDAEGGVGRVEDDRVRAGGRPPAHHDRGVPPRQAADGPRPHRLQPERLGTHPRLGVLRAPDAVRGRLHAGHVGGDRARHPPRGLPARQRAVPGRAARRPLGPAPRRRRALRPPPPDARYAACTAASLMTTMTEHVNVGDAERAASVLGGVALLVYGLARGTLAGSALALLGGALAYRGLGGHCPLYDALGIDTSEGGRRARAAGDAIVEQASEDSFPASDAPSWTPTT